jgi:deoxyguanosine kinase
MKATFPHKFIAIEGNIGAGKTTLCKMLESDYPVQLILEQFTDNPFLPHFYENPERYAFPVELFFMTERHKQLQAHLSQQNLFPELLISDYYFIKTLLFAKNNLEGAEFRLFQRLFHILNNSFPKPDLLVFLHRSVDDLLFNIKNRGRSFEVDIKGPYLEKVQQGYYNFFRTQADLPILILDVESVYFWNDPAAYQQIVAAIAQNYPPGMHHLRIPSSTPPTAK